MISDWKNAFNSNGSIDLPFKNDLYGPVFLVFHWKLGERLCWSTVVKQGKAYDIMC